MTQRIPVVIGSRGLADGEFFVLGDKMTISFGRSRHCDVCLLRFQKYLGLSDAERTQQDERNARVSRVHCQITVNGTKILFENQSLSGTFLNNQKHTERHEQDLAEGDIAVRLGLAEENYQFTLMTPEAIEAHIKTLPPPVRKAAPPAKAAEPVQAVKEPVVAAEPAGGIMVTIHSGGAKKSAAMPAGANLLEFFEEKAGEWPHSCRAGSCGVCKTRCISGRANITNIQEPSYDEVAANEFLACCSSTTGPIEVEQA